MKYVYVLIGASSLVWAVGWIYQRWRRTQPDEAWKPTGVVYLTGRTGERLKHDEALALRTRRRRDAADAIRARASSVESGASVGVLLRRAK